MRSVLRMTLAVGLCGVVCAALCAAAETTGGTTPDELAAEKLPQPADARVAILLFSDYRNSQDHVNYARESLTRRFAAEGFPLVNSALVQVAAQQDKNLEPGEALRRDDALRFGKMLGADWVVYGSILQLETYRHQSYFSNQKKAKVSIKLSVVRVVDGKIFYWAQKSDIKNGGMGVFVKSGSSLERDAADSLLAALLQPLFAALPAHAQVKELGEACDMLDAGACANNYKDKPDSLEVGLLRGQSLLVYKQAPDAEKVFAAIQRRHADSVAATAWHGLAWWSAGDATKAKAEWDRVLAQNAEDELTKRFQQVCIACQPAPPPAP